MAHENQELERLKQKYQPALNLMQQLQVQLRNVNMDGDKLLIRGVAPTAEAKNKVWDQITLIDPTFSDLACDLRVAQEAPATMTAAASISDGQAQPRDTVKPRETLSINQPRVILRCQSLREDLQRKTRSPPGSEYDQPRSGFGDSRVVMTWTDQLGDTFDPYTGTAAASPAATARKGYRAEP
jgi:hypothetical protein